MKFKKIAKTSVSSLILVVAISFSASIEAVSAQENLPVRGSKNKKRPNPEKLFAKMDIDKDGKLSKTEVKRRLANHFSKIDTDKDGFISKEELKNKKRPNPEKLFAERDIDKDGKLSKTEVKGRLANHFSKIDADKDGFISKEELKNAKQKRGRKKHQ